MSFVTALIVLVCILQVCRHAPPPAIGTPAEQHAMAELIARWCGINLPSGARIVAYSGEDERDGRYYYWVLFTAKEPTLPGTLAAFKNLFEPRVERTTRSIERSMIPYKIRGARRVNDYAWSHGDYEVIALTVEAEAGWYTWLDAARQDRHAPRPGVPAAGPPPGGLSPDATPRRQRSQ